MKAKFINENMKPRMSEEEFEEWFNDISNYQPDLPWYNIVSSLENDENSTDGELYSYFIEDLKIENHELINELLDKREYFMDFQYAQHINV
jgi:hypothetical protein